MIKTLPFQQLYLVFAPLLLTPYLRHPWFGILLLWVQLNVKSGASGKLLNQIILKDKSNSLMRMGWSCQKMKENTQGF
uniref:Uncharacterized protein LOC8286879 isoform X2 n=1 Tax=Rhizophora mucronata TaxID=61149 RepID=A0A2P2Q9L1_RHIMU